MEKFDKGWLMKLWRPTDAVGKMAGGQVTIIGGSSLFHGAPILALQGASRLVSLVYFATPEVDREIVEKIKSELGSFIWIPRDELGDYVAKSDAVLIGPGMMRNTKEKDGTVCDDLGKETRDLVLTLFEKFPQKKWVVDGGALQIVEAADIPSGSVITPNKKEFRMLFGEDLSGDLGKRARRLQELAARLGLIILAKDVVSIAADGNSSVLIRGGNVGLIKGGTGDVLAGLAVGLLAKNEPLLAISAAQYLVKRAADKLAEKVGLMYNADDLAEEVGRVYREEVSQ